MRSSAWIWLFIVDTEHQRAVRRRQIEPGDVADLVHEQRIAGELEGLRAVRLHAEAATVVVPEGDDFNDDLVSLGTDALRARLMPLLRFAGAGGG